MYVQSLESQFETQVIPLQWQMKMETPARGSRTAEENDTDIQGDRAAFAKPPVDFKSKVPRPKRNF